MGKDMINKHFFERIGRFHDGGFKNESHFMRYDMNDIRRVKHHNGSSVVPVYKYQGLFDNGVGELPRGMDSRNAAKCHRARLSRDKEYSSLIMDNPMN